MLRKHWASGLAIEWIMAGLILLSLGRVLWHLFTFKYLPAPYFYEPSDVQADWFNTAFWSYNPHGAFDTWTTLYPPLSFVILRALSIGECYPRSREFESSPGYAARDCDWLGHVSIYSFYVLAVVLMYVALRKLDAKRAIPRTICIGLGWPMLNAVERGNLVLIAFPFFLLAVMPILKSARARWIFAALAINLKVYLVAPFLTQLFMRRWRWVESVLVATVIVYLLSYAAFGAGTIFEIIRNLAAWSEIEITAPLDFWPATTYQGLVSLLESRDQVFPTVYVLGSWTVDVVPIAVQIVLRSTQGVLLLAMIATWLRPEAVTRYRVYLLGMLFALITTEGGGYTPVFWIALILMERWEGIGPRFALICCYVIGCSYDIPITNLATVERYSYIFDRPVIVEMDMTVWPLFRPLFIQLIAIAMACSTIGVVWKDVRAQGWADRWRFRRDAPLLPWVQRPAPVSERLSSK